LSANYTNETAPKQLGTIDEVKEIKVSEVDGYKLLVRFNDSYYKDLKISSTDADSEGFITKDGKSYKVLDGQIYNNLGVVRTTPEFLTGKQLEWGEWEETTSGAISFDINKIITYLNTTYSDGFVLTDNNNFYGKSIAVPMEKTENADCGLFAYDYAEREWKYLGKLGAQAVASYIDIIQNSNTTINMTRGLANSIILCYEEVDI
jgi:hypothetical protein